MKRNQSLQLTKLRQIIKEEISKSSNENSVKKIIGLLQQAQDLADIALDATNFDVVDLSQTLENYIDELSKIGAFKK
jgi:hypothetical protein